MNNKSSVFERLLMYMILAYAGMWIMHNYFDSGKSAQVKDRPLPAQPLVQAFKGIDPASGPALTTTAAKKEVTTLTAEIAKNDKDDYSRWAHLRVGLIQQYILEGGVPKDNRKSGFLGLGPHVEFYVPYDEISRANKHDAVEAQALYQEGDLFWRQSLKAPDKKGEIEAVTAFEAIVANERTSQDFRDAEIYVTKEPDPAKVDLTGIPPQGFKQVRISSLRGSLTDYNPQGVLDRINEHYKPSLLYKLFDGVVRALGAQPGYSYGLAILIFAVCTRTLMQPLSKKQYESMKGMALIAPEMKKIQERYKNKSDQESQMKMVKEIQELQRRHGVNPYMGCVLAFVQMPIFFFLIYPMIKHYQPTMDLAGAHFLWIADLSQKDIVLLVLYGISMFFSFRLSSTPPTDDAQRAMQRTMSFMMPVVLPFFLLTYPSAFVMYWMTFNIMSTTFQWRMMKAADPKKNIVKTLMGADLAAPAAETASDAVPPRPKGGSKSSKNNGSALSVDGDSPLEGGKAETNGSHNGSSSNGHLNGNANTGAAASGGKKKKR